MIDLAWYAAVIAGAFIGSITGTLLGHRHAAKTLQKQKRSKAELTGQPNVHHADTQFSKSACGLEPQDQCGRPRNGWHHTQVSAVSREVLCLECASSRELRNGNEENK